MAGWYTHQPQGPRLKKNKAAVQSGPKKQEVPPLWASCPSCQQLIFKNDLSKHLNVCPSCSYHMPLSAKARIDALLDTAELTIGEEVMSHDWVGFIDNIPYKQRVDNAQKKTGLSEALLVKYGKLNGQSVVMAVFDFEFIGGSMGSAVGERFVKAVHHAIKKRCPLVCVASSGGARMQESLFSLMQMSKTAAALGRLSKCGLCYIVVLASPCMGGVSASLAMLGDLIIAEPKATIGFTGRRVIEQTIKGVLPKGFQESEFLLEHGSVDMVVDRRELKDTLARLLRRLAQGVY